MNKFQLDTLIDYSNENIISELQRVAFLIKKSQMIKKEFDTLSKVHSSTVTRRFGGWNKALLAAGLSNMYSGKSVTSKQKLQQSKRWTNQELLDELKEISKKKNSKILTVEDIKENSNFIGPSILRSRFGSLENAVKQAGLEISIHAKRYTENQCFENLLNVWKNPKLSRHEKTAIDGWPKDLYYKMGIVAKSVTSFCG